MNPSIRKLPLFAAAVLMGALWANPAQAQDMKGDAEAGKKTAEQFCAACHMREGGSVKLPGKKAPPPFKDVAQREGFSAETVADIMAAPKHPARHVKLNEQQTADVAAFIRSLEGDN